MVIVVTTSLVLVNKKFSEQVWLPLSGNNKLGSVGLPIESFGENWLLGVERLMTYL